MPLDIKESDWKIFRVIRETAVDRAYERGAAEMQYVIADKAKPARDRFHEVGDIYERRREEIANAFDGLSRSKAVTQLAIMRRQKLVTDVEMAQFSENLQSSIKQLLTITRQ